MFYKIGINTLISSAGRVLGSALALFSIALMTRTLGADSFGEYATVIAYLTTFQILADFGLYSLLTREISQNQAKEGHLLGTFFTLRLLIALFVIGSSVALVFLFPYSQEVKIAVVFASIGFIAISLTQLFLGVFQAHVSVYKGAVVEVFGRLLQLALVIAAAAMEAGLLSFIAIFVATSLFIFVANAVLAWRTTPFRIYFSLREARSIIRTALPIAVSIVFTLLYFRLDTVMLSVMKPPQDVGFYNLSYRILETLIFFPAVFIGLFLPVLSRQTKHAKEELSSTLSFLSDAMFASALPLVVGGVLLSSSVVVVAGGGDFIEAGPALAVLLGAVGAIFFGTLFGSSIVALDMQKRAIWVYAGGFVLNFAANLIVIPSYSYVGAAFTTLFTEAIVALLLGVLIWRRVRFHISPRVFWGGAVATLAMGGTLWLVFDPYGKVLPFSDLLVAILLGAFIYLIIASSFGPSLLRRAKSISY